MHTIHGRAELTCHDLARAVAQAIEPLRAKRLLQELRAVRPGFELAERRREQLEKALSIFEFAAFACRNKEWYDVLRALKAVEQMGDSHSIWWKPYTTRDGKGYRDILCRIRQRLEEHYQLVASLEARRLHAQYPWRYGRW